VLALADQAGFSSEGLPVLAYAYATMSAVQCEWNHVETAVALARQSLTLAEQWRQADTVHFALTCLSQALCAAGDLEAAFAANQRAMQLGVNVSPWFYRLSVLDEVLMNLAKGEVTAAAQRFAELEPSVDEQSKKGMFLVTKSALLYAQGRFSDTLLVIDQSIGEIEQRARFG
jgi:ATP/maltotriose-dependent transcriptional regulator MalT